MAFIVRQFAPTAKLPDEIALEALARAVPPATIHAVIADLGVAEQRKRALPTAVTLLFVLAMNLFTHQNLGAVYQSLVAGLRLFWPDPDLPPVTPGALVQARYRVGARPVAELFRRVCCPCATPTTPGAFAFGLRLMAIDGTLENVPDTPANRRAFGGPSNQAGTCAFPQVHAVYLVECGTHGVVDAGFWPYRTGERCGGLRLLRSVSRGMLVLWDRGFHGYAMAVAARARQAHFLGRVPNNVNLRPIQGLRDGSYLAWLRPAEHGPVAARQGAPLLVRVVAYRLEAPGRPGHRHRHRLMTSVLNPRVAPARDLAVTYHERWEAELVIDEQDTHLRLVRRPLRSQKPVGVIQELYGLLIAHYAIRLVMVEAAEAAGIAPLRLSFTHAVECVRVAIREFQQVTPQQHGALYARLLRDVGRGRLPARDGRSNPRVVRRQQSKFRVKRANDYGANKLDKPFADTVVLLNQPVVGVSRSTVSVRLTPPLHRQGLPTGAN